MQDVQDIFVANSWRTNRVLVPTAVPPMAGNPVFRLQSIHF
jgi:hypothetical protein